MGRPRQVVRDHLLQIVRKLCEKDETKAAVTGMLAGLLHEGMPDGLSDRTAPYADVGTASVEHRTAQRTDIIFITARFRSGSTLLWNVFRQVTGMTAYYEPLNERRWFDPSARGNRMDATHRNVDDYWREYDGLEELGRYYREDWIRKRLFMDAAAWDPDLKRYIEIMVERARGRPVLQFNRVDFRVPWLRHQFPGAKLVHLFRHPRDQWCSSLMDLSCFSKDGRTDAFEPHDKFYLLNWARDLKYHFPFLDERGAEHPYQLFYYMWKLSYVFGLRFSHHSVCFETLVNHPDRELPALFKAVGVDGYDLDRVRAILVKPAIGKWTAYADDAWFKRHETHCETVLAEFLRKPAKG